jgi:hypothetical protein
MSQEDPLDAMEIWLRARLEDLHISLPGTVTTYNKDTRLATVKPSVRPRSLHGDVFDIPPIQGVPVIWPGSQEFTVQGTLKRGDRVLLVFSEASIGNWIRGQGDVDAEDETRFSLQDAIAIPGLWPTSAVPKHPLDTAAWGLSSDLLEIGGTKAGKAVVKNASASLGEILGDMKNILALMDAHHTALNALIPGYPSQVTAITSLIGKIGALLE